MHAIFIIYYYLSICQFFPCYVLCNFELVNFVPIWATSLDECTVVYIVL